MTIADEDEGEVVVDGKGEKEVVVRLPSVKVTGVN